MSNNNLQLLSLQQNIVSFYKEYLIFDHDDREPIFYFTIPFPSSLLSSPIFGGGEKGGGGGGMVTFGFVNLDIFFWLETFVFLCIQSIINALIAIVVYKYIVIPQQRKRQQKRTNKQQQHLQQQNASTSNKNGHSKNNNNNHDDDESNDNYNANTSIHHLLLGYGIICPLLLLVPIYVFTNVLHMSNVALMLCLGGAFSVLVFRVVETMHEMIPEFATSNVWNFILYYGATLQYQFDPKTQQPIPLTYEIFRYKVTKFVSVLIQTSLLYSLLLPYHYKVAPQKEIQSILDLYYWGNLVNAYLMASLTSLVLDGGASGLGLLQSIGSGYAMESFSDAPLTKSTSPSNFWGQRWDRPVQSALRRGVFQPLRKKAKLSRNVAAIVTFLVSGILHEYVLLFMSLKQKRQEQQEQYTISTTMDGNNFGIDHTVLGVGGAEYPGEYDNVHLSTTSLSSSSVLYGSHFLFFVWNGIVLMLERACQGHYILQWMESNLPQPIRTFLVLLLVLPIAHLFTDEYIKSGFFDDAVFGFPKLVYIGTTK